MAYEEKFSTLFTDEEEIGEEKEGEAEMLDDDESDETDEKNLNDEFNEE